MYRRHGKQTEIGLGSATGKGKAGVVTLEQARRKAHAIHATIGDGADPLKVKRARAVTFAHVADQLIESRKAGWTARTEHGWRHALSVHAAALRPRPIAEITVDEIVAVLKPLWLDKAETAKKLRERLEAVFDAAKAKGKRSGDNPAAMKGNLDTLLPQRPTLQRGHHPAIPFRSITSFWHQLDDGGITTAALKLLILTATRTSQTTLARWSEFDLDAAMPVWTIAAARNLKSKTKDSPAVPHSVPLTPTMLALLRDLKARAIPGEDRLFPQLADGALLDRFRAVEGFAGYAVHGLRSTYRDWGTVETEFAADVLNAAYGHVVHNKVERAYAREKALAKHLDVFKAWNAYVTNGARLQLVT